MSRGASSDHALLARLNALKKSTIDLEARTPTFDGFSSTTLPADPAPASSLHKDLLSRFNFLNGQPTNLSAKALAADGDGDLNLLADEDGKTVEDLLAELGPEESWDIAKDEEGQISELLKSAQYSLKDADKADNDRDSGDRRLNQEGGRQPLETDRIGVDLKQAREQMSGFPEPTEQELDEDADEYLAEVLEQIRHEPRPITPEAPMDTRGADQSCSLPHTQNTSIPSFNLPSAPIKEPDPPPPSYAEISADDDLASRFANLGLPSVPTTIKSATTNSLTNQKPKAYSDEEIDSWCIICNDDATLSCVGCVGDLYCTNCWLEGHKSPDAGHEERKHKAVQYSKGGGIKKLPVRRLVGA